jgi:hypothetical protein
MTKTWSADWRDQTSTEQKNSKWAY